MADNVGQLGCMDGQEAAQGIQSDTPPSYPTPPIYHTHSHIPHPHTPHRDHTCFPVLLCLISMLTWNNSILDQTNLQTHSLYCPQIKERCRKGIPSSLRGRAWQRLSGAKKLLQANAGLFHVSLFLFFPMQFANMQTIVLVVPCTHSYMSICRSCQRSSI